MSTLIQDKTEAFFEILSSDKKRWPDFYFQYVKDTPKAFKAYHSSLEFDEKDIEKRILSFERRELDTCFQNMGALGEYELISAKKLADGAADLGLDISKLRVYLVGALNYEPIFMADKETALVDVLPLYGMGFSNLPDLILEGFAKVGG